TFLGDLSCAIVADLRRETRHHRHRELDQFATTFFVRFNPYHTFLGERVGHISEQPDRFQNVVRHHWHHHVQLEISIRTRPGDDSVISENLRAHHHHRFAQYRVYFPGHDRAARLRRR